MEYLSNTIQRLSESATLAMARKSRELKQAGKDVISLSLGEPDFHTPEFIKDAAKNAIDQNFSKYPPVNGYLDLREAISKKFLRDNNLSYSPDEIVVSNGAKQSILNVVMALVSPGEEVILPAPYWVSYIEMVKMAGGIPVIIESDISTDFKISPSQLEKTISEKTKLIIFSSPCNPTGSVYTEHELQDIADVLKSHERCFVVSDEIYEHINFEGKHVSIANFDGMKDKTITVNGVSKSFAMTGWRIGYIGAPQGIAKACAKIQGQVTSGACGIAQKAAKEAVLADPSVVDSMNTEFKKRRDYLLKELSNIKDLLVNKPSGAFYLFPDISKFLGRSFKEHKINSSEDLCQYILQEELLALVPGSAFGSPNNIRISYAASDEQLQKAVHRLKTALEKLQ